MIKKIGVFCGSARGVDPEFAEKTIEAAHFLSSHQVEAVYGGGNIGLMGILADAMLAQGGKIHGVIPHHLKEKEIAHPSLTSLEVVPDMSQRKEIMISRSDAFLILPGGAGTLDELFEVMVMNQLQLHAKPILILNTGGFFTALMDFIDHAVKKGFIRHEHLRFIFCDPNIEKLWRWALEFSPEESLEQWIKALKSEKLS